MTCGSGCEPSGPLTTPLPKRTDGAEVGFTSGSPRPPAQERAEVTECVGRGSKPPRAATASGGVAHGAGVTLCGQPDAPRYAQYRPVTTRKSARTVAVAGQFGRD